MISDGGPCRGGIRVYIGAMRYYQLLYWSDRSIRRCASSGRSGRRAFVFALVWCEVMTMIAAGALIGLGFGWIGAQAISRIVEARTGLAVAAAIARPELVMVLSLMLVGALLAIVPAS